MRRKGDTDVNKFAPFSHDAQSMTSPPPPPAVPESAAIGVIGLAALATALSRLRS